MMMRTAACFNACSCILSSVASSTFTICTVPRFVPKRYVEWAGNQVKTVGLHCHTQNYVGIIIDQAMFLTRELVVA